MHAAVTIASALFIDLASAMIVPIPCKSARGRDRQQSSKNYRRGCNSFEHLSTPSASSDVPQPLAIQM
jgi:hypothetical protein